MNSKHQIRRSAKRNPPRRMKSLSGMSLAEVMIAAVILVIALIGTSASFVSGRKYIINQQFYRAAAQLAGQKLEELKAIGYDGVAIGEIEEEVSFNGTPYQRQTETILTSEVSVDTPKPCKKVTVTISWSIAESQHEARLVTYIGP